MFEFQCLLFRWQQHWGIQSFIPTLQPEGPACRSSQANNLNITSEREKSSENEAHLGLPHPQLPVLLLWASLEVGVTRATPPASWVLDESSPPRQSNFLP